MKTIKPTSTDGLSKESLKSTLLISFIVIVFFILGVVIRVLTFNPVLR
jgi:hypothetical protein